MNDQQLYQNLYSLRDSIKLQVKRREGKAPTVCTDTALQEIVRLRPLKKDDLYAVPGVGKTFVDKYGDDFVAIVQKWTEKVIVNTEDINDSTRKTIKELEKKLVNINKNNKLLYIPKLPDKLGFDLYDKNTSANPYSFLFSENSRVICNVLNNDNYLAEKANYKRLNTLIREISRNYRETGQYDLYIGFPFVIGRLMGENFDVRAPLALFPVQIMKEPTSISIIADDSRDAIYNNSLILAYYKFNGINKPLPNNVIEDVNASGFINNLLSFYNEQGMSIQKTEHVEENISKFKEYMADEFPSFHEGILKLEWNMVLGKYPICASSIQKDFDDILDRGTINGILSELLQNVENIDYFSDKFSGLDEKDKNLDIHISERQLTYIGELNSSQENVITAIKKREALVVQGPPGTGKSQTITSLITDFVNNGKNVLMVSEKKAALDVVYSRLGNLNQYAILIDDASNKSEFYGQMEHILNISNVPQVDITKIDELSDQIDADIARLNKIGRVLYETNEFGIEAYKLYLMNDRLDIASPEGSKEYLLYQKYVRPLIYQMNYEQLDKICNKLKQVDFVAMSSRYAKILADLPWFSSLKENLSEYEVAAFMQDSAITQNETDAWRNNNFIIRLFTKGKVIKKVKEFSNKYFNQYSKDMIKMLIDNAGKMGSKIYQYHDYIMAKPIYQSMNVSEAEYFMSVLALQEVSGNTFYNDNNALFNYTIGVFLQKFEAEHRDVLQSMSDFKNIIADLNRLYVKKKKLVETKLQAVLYREITNITSSKRQGEISRVVEMKKKWSINKYIKKFSFELFKGIRIWLLTPEVASDILPLEAGLFDLVIFDEASQLYIERGIPAIVRGKKIVVAGDSKQLRPSSLGTGKIDFGEENEADENYEGNAALEEESLLDLARFRYVPPVLLNFHYRSKYEELIAFSNYAFYKGKLCVSPNAETPELPPIEVIKINDGLWESRHNRNEAAKAVELLKLFYKERKNNDTVGIITFNSSQRDLILDVIDDDCSVDQGFSMFVKTEMNRKENGEDIGLFVKNIENVQGDERDTIIFSIGYAKNTEGRLIRNFGWLNQKGGENRLNVAISRAKKKIYIITSFEPHELQVEDCTNDGPRYLKKYLEYCFAISGGNKEAAKQVLHSFGDADNTTDNIRFDSDFEIMVYDALRDRGYQVETQVGIGGYSIDLAIKKNGQYVLGIECDGKLYHNSKSARERDYHRQKYLESRGWKIHRVWSPNWWRNPDGEIDKIESIVKH
ncbi:MAG: AAA domain-containing protein [Mobilitalea sp.]